MASYINYEEVSGELEYFLEAVDSILQQCAVHEGIQETGFVLRLVNSLQNAITVLQCILNNERITGNSPLEYLLFLICSILQQWEHKLFHLEAFGICLGQLQKPLHVNCNELVKKEDLPYP